MDTNWSRHQRAHNSAMRIATGCHKMADVIKLNQEARELPVCQQSEPIFLQLPLVCHLPQYPRHQLSH